MYRYKNSKRLELVRHTRDRETLNPMRQITDTPSDIAAEPPRDNAAPRRPRPSAMVGFRQDFGPTLRFYLGDVAGEAVTEPLEKAMLAFLAGPLDRPVTERLVLDRAGRLTCFIADLLVTWVEPQTIDRDRRLRLAHAMIDVQDRLAAAIEASMADAA